MFDGQVEDAGEAKPQWLVDGPPQFAKERWPRGAFSPSWMKLLQLCPLKHAESYRRRNKEPASKEMNVGTAVHSALAWAGIRRLRAMYRGIPSTPSRDELLHLVEHEPVAQTDPEVLSRAREIIVGMPPVSMDGIVAVENLLTYDVGGVKLAGYSDQESVKGDIRGHHEVVVTDYKTGADVPDEAELFHDAQAGMYLVSARRRYPQASRILFRILNVTLGQEVRIPWSLHLQAEFEAAARAAVNLWNAHDETAKPGKHCEYCQIALGCQAFKDTLKRARSMRETGYAELPLAKKIEMYRDMTMIEAMAAKAKSGLSDMIESEIPKAQKSYSAGLLQLTRKRRQYKSWDDPIAVVREIAGACGLGFEELASELLSGLTEAKVNAFVKTLPDAARVAAEEVVKRRLKNGVSSEYMEVREAKGRSLF